MPFKVIDNKLLKKYNKLWEKVSSFINIKFGSEPVYGDNDEYIKTKIKLYGDKVNIIIRANKKYYLQTLLEECKYEIRKNKMENFINDDLDSSSSDESDSESDNEFDNGSDNETDNFNNGFDNDEN